MTKVHKGNGGASHSCKMLKQMVDDGETSQEESAKQIRVKSLGKTSWSLREV